MSHPYRHFMDTIISKVSLTLKLITYIFGSCIDLLFILFQCCYYHCYFWFHINWPIFRVTGGFALSQK